MELTIEYEKLINETSHRPGHPIRKPEDMPTKVTTIPINKEWKESLKKDMWWSTNYEGELDQQCEHMLQLRSFLLPYGGEEVCLPYKDEDLEKIISRGQLWYGDKAKKIKGEACHCHSNSCDIWEANKEYSTIATGYALSDDGMWRQHSWVLYLRPRTTQIIETTVKRLLYFGFAMTEEECEDFVEYNW